MNRLKLASKSFAYSWNLIFESSKYLIFLYFALVLIILQRKYEQKASERNRNMVTLGDFCYCGINSYK